MIHYETSSLQQVAIVIATGGRELLNLDSSNCVEIELNDGRKIIGTRYEGIIQPHLISSSGYISEDSSLIFRTNILYCEHSPDLPKAFITTINFGKPNELTVLWEIEESQKAKIPEK